MVTPDEPSVLVMAPFGSHREIALYPDSRVVKANCGHMAWLSPQGERYVDTAYTVCVSCADGILEDRTSQRLAVPGALEAVRARLGSEAAIESYELMQRLGIRRAEDVED